ncbi:OB-fold domain-containing protein [Candidatus Poriferisocius sp.]|uniref:OB-fold domain-containing protein n=1 Tax=Candidatus Poriferisocius sp. TaxID=3101276 RepID=UPI003B016F11
MTSATFGPGATVFSSTVLRIPVPGRTPPFTLAYVDVDDGPRILAHVDGPDEPLVPGSRVALAGWSEHGDPVVQGTGP